MVKIMGFIPFSKDEFLSIRLFLVPSLNGEILRPIMRFVSPISTSSTVSACQCFKRWDFALHLKVE
jgi:hypothetical protein